MYFYEGLRKQKEHFNKLTCKSNLRRHQITAWPSFRLEARNLSRQLSDSQPYRCSAKECLNLKYKRYNRVNDGQVQPQDESLSFMWHGTKQLSCKMHTCAKISPRGEDWVASFFVCVWNLVTYSNFLKSYDTFLT